MNVDMNVARSRLFDPRIYPLMVLALIGLTVAAFYVLGFRGDLRWIKLAIGISIVVAIMGARLSTGVGVFLVATIFPAFIVIGPTNFVIAVLMLVSWLARIAWGSEPRPKRSPCDIPLALLTIAYAISWLNVPREPYAINQAWYYTQNQIGSLIVFYVAYSAVKEERDAHILFRFMQVLAILVYVGAILEVTLGISITGLGKVQAARYKIGGELVRAGGLLGSHDMLADFCSMNIPLHLYLFFRSRHYILRLAYAVLAITCIVVLFMTSNRGGIVGFGAGLLYLAFLLRRQIGARALVGVLSGGATLFLAVDLALSRAGRTLSVFYRLAQTRFYGVLPETRVGVYEHFKSRIVENFWLGEGPFYRLRPKDASEIVFWPHNALAYYWATVGVLGMVSFLALILQIFVLSAKERARRLGEGDIQEVLLILHVMVFVFVVAQQRTDFQRGFVFTYYAFFLLGFTVGAWRLARRRRLEAEAEGLAAEAPGGA